MATSFTFRVVRPIAATLGLSAALVQLVACHQGAPRYLTNPMAPAGSTPAQVRVFCTELGDEAADWNFTSGDPTGPSNRARDRVFAACMARNHVTP